MVTIQLRRDAYGQHARHSAIADYLELLALSGRTVYEADLARRFEQDGLRLDPSPDDSQRPGEDEVDRHADQAARVFSVLEQRAKALRDLYPFAFDQGLRGLARASGPAVCGLYVPLLATTVAQSHGITDQHKLARLFELLVGRCLRSIGLRTATIGTSQTRKGSFKVRLQAACREVGIGRVSGNALVSKYAGDEKVDTLAHVDLRDERTGRWYFIGQSTIAKSDEWDQKFGEPKTSTWRQLVDEQVSPAKFLAVPHHVERWHWAKLTQDHSALILDRLRLTLSKESPTKEEQRIVRTVTNCEVEW